MYITCNVHLVQTKEKAKIGELTTNVTNLNALFIMSKRVYDGWEAIFSLTDEKEGSEHLRGNHLIITSDDEIKIGHRMFDTETEIITLCRTTTYFNNKRWKKIIASTDLRLSLPKPPEKWIEHFIKEYERGNQIINVQVKHEPIIVQDCDILTTHLNLKTTDNNEIIINTEPVEPILYTEQEVKEFFELYRKYLDEFPTVRTTKKKLDVWFKENKK